jgi:hypothetical protein
MALSYPIRRTRPAAPHLPQIIAPRYDANEVMGGVTEVLAYGTAVQVEQIR